MKFDAEAREMDIEHYYGILNDIQIPYVTETMLDMLRDKLQKYLGCENRVIVVIFLTLDY